MLWLFHLSMRHWKLTTSYAKYSVHMWQTFYQQLGSAISKAENGEQRDNVYLELGWRSSLYILYLFGRDYCFDK